MNFTKNTKKHSIIISVLFIMLILTAGENFRAGYEADIKNMNGCQTNLLGCWGFPITLLILAALIIYVTILFIIKTQNTNQVLKK